MRTTPSPLQLANLVPVAAQTAIGLTHAMAIALGALVLVTSLVPVFAVCMAALGTRDAARRPLSRSSGPAQESA
jgi:hypothetical protein